MYTFFALSNNKNERLITVRIYEDDYLDIDIDSHVFIEPYSRDLILNSAVMEGWIQSFKWMTSLRKWMLEKEDLGECPKVDYENTSGFNDIKKQREEKMNWIIDRVSTEMKKIAKILDLRFEVLH